LHANHYVQAQLSARYEVDQCKAKDVRVDHGDRIWMELHHAAQHGSGGLCFVLKRFGPWWGGNARMHGHSVQLSALAKLHQRADLK
jgi:hypothetical protein